MPLTLPPTALSASFAPLFTASEFPREAPWRGRLEEIVTDFELDEPPPPPPLLSELPHADTPSAQRTTQPEAAIKEFLKNPLLNGYSVVVGGIIRTRRADDERTAEEGAFAGLSPANSTVRRRHAPTLA